MNTTEPELDLVVEKAEIVANGVRTLVLRPPAGGRLPAWRPGSHVDVIAGGFTRQYSLCGSPEDDSWTVAVLREPDGRGGSAYLHDVVREGDTVRVRGPRNHFALVESPSYLFVAGGIGITPLLPMIAAAQAREADWHLVYGGRTRTSMAFADDLARQYGERVEVLPEDETGLLPLDALLSSRDPATSVYCCGPEPLLLAMEQRCTDQPSCLHLERFAPMEQGEPVRSGSFEVELSESGITLTIPPDRSVLSVLEEHGVAPLSSCTEGTCGTCETGVLAGEVDHRDSLLSADERAANDVMFVCVSRARSDRLVLEL